ncbi:MAG TPA: type II toxin-antitoxin system PemK/MazF family toxin [Propionibacterium sp.]|nr:type II toxin-antitoxin system PemK/MazF family toxin [Propionibacterium sp.]
MRGDVFELPSPRGAKGHEQRGNRFAVVVQSDDLPLSTLLVAPTSTSARPTVFRPEIELRGSTTVVLVEQTAAVDPNRLGAWAGRLSLAEMQLVDQALRLAMGLD